MESPSSVAHIKKSIMDYIFEQKKPLFGNYSQIKNNYIDRLLRNEVAQMGPNIGKITNSLYSSLKPENQKTNKKADYQSLNRIVNDLYSSIKPTYSNSSNSQYSSDEDNSEKDDYLKQFYR